MRCKTVEVSPQLLCQMLRNGTGMVEVAENPLPEDARIIDVKLNHYTGGQIVLVIESNTYPEVPEGNYYVSHGPIIFQRLDVVKEYKEFLAVHRGPR